MVYVLSLVIVSHQRHVDLHDQSALMAGSSEGSKTETYDQKGRFGYVIIGFRTPVSQLEPSAQCIIIIPIVSQGGTPPPPLGGKPPCPLAPSLWTAYWNQYDPSVTD